MKTTILALMILFGAKNLNAQKESEIRIISETFSDNIIKNDFKKCTSFFNENMVKQFPPDQLASIWSTILKQYGSFQSVETLYYEKKEIGWITTQPFQFEITKLDLQLTFDAQSKITSLLFKPHQLRKFDLRDTKYYKEEEILLSTNEDIQLKGILTLPTLKDKCPVAILVHGSGPTDIDATVGPNKLFKDLAADLAIQGIAVIRYQKRTRVYAEDPKLDYINLTLYEETIEDAITATELACSIEQIDPNQVYIIGHSLGAMSAPLIAKKSKHVNGIVMIAGNATPLSNVILDQLNYLYREDGELDKEEAKDIQIYEALLENLAALKGPNPKEPLQLPLNLPPAYWYYLKNYDQVKTAQKLKKPILILQGERDYQVTMKEYEAWKDALGNKSNVHFESFEKLNHIMREGTGKSYPNEYNVQSELPQYLTESISNWIKKNQNL